MTRDIASVNTDDSVEFDPDSIDIQQIRDDADYPRLRVRIRARLHTARRTVEWDVSTGDPIVPAPQRVRVPRALGDDIHILGYAHFTSLSAGGVILRAVQTRPAAQQAGRSRVSAQTAERIRAVAAELGYRSRDMQCSPEAAGPVL